MRITILSTLLVALLCPTLESMMAQSTSMNNPSRQSFSFTALCDGIEYVYSGSCDITTRYDKGTNSANLAILLNAMEKKPASQELGEDSPSSFLSGDTALKMQYPMRGGPALDYRTGTAIIDELYLYFYYETESNLNERPCQGDISFGGNVKFQLDLKKVIVIPVQFDVFSSTSNKIRANGTAWPSEELSTAAIEGLLDQANSSPNLRRPGDFGREIQQFYANNTEGAPFYGDWTYNKAEGALQVTRLEVKLVLESARKYYADHGFAPMVLHIYVQADEKWNACASIVTHKKQRSDIGITNIGALNVT